MKKLSVTIESQNLSNYGWEADASYDLTLKNCTFTKDNLPPMIDNLRLISCDRTPLDITVNSTLTVESYQIRNFESFKGLKAEKFNVIDCAILSFDNLEDLDIKQLALDSTVIVFSNKDTQIPSHIKLIATEQQEHGFKLSENVEILETVLHF